MTATLDFQKGIWIHQTDQLGEKSIADVAATCKQFDITQVYLKVFDQTSYMGNGIDTGAERITSIQKFNDVYQRGRAAGIEVIPWVVAGHRTDAIIHAILAPHPVIVDLEPYPQFWQDSVANVPNYIADLKAHDVEEVFISIDPRNWQVDTLQVAQWAGQCEGLLPQLYWTDFQQNEASIIPALESAIQAFDGPMYPVYPYNGTAVDMQDAWRYAVGTGATGCSLWRMGIANKASLSAFSALELPNIPIPLATMTNNDVVELMRRLLTPSGLNPGAADAYLRQFVAS